MNVGLCEGLGDRNVSNSASGRPCESELGNRSVSLERTHHGVNPCEWEVGSSFSHDEQVQTRRLCEDSAATSSEPDSESGLDDPKTWRFGPSYRSDMIIVAARGISLV